MPCADFGWDTLHGRRPVQAIFCSIGSKAQLHYLNVIMGSNYGSTGSPEREIIRKGFPPIQGKMYPNLYCVIFVSFCSAFTTRNECSVTFRQPDINWLLYDTAIAELQEYLMCNTVFK